MKTIPSYLTGKTTLAELAGVIQAADLYIGADSGVMHIAELVGTPIVAIFGPSNADAWHPGHQPANPSWFAAHLNAAHAAMSVTILDYAKAARLEPVCEW